MQPLEKTFLEKVALLAGQWHICCGALDFRLHWSPWGSPPSPPRANPCSGPQQGPRLEPPPASGSFHESRCICFLELSYQRAADWVALTPEVHSVLLLGAGSSKSRCGQSWVLPRAMREGLIGVFLLASGSLSRSSVAGGRVPPGSSHLFPCACVCLMVHMTCFCRGTGYSGAGPTAVTSF